jgi:hypothetical protein
MKIIKDIKEIFTKSKLKENEVCNAESCWCKKCDAHYANNFKKACEASGVKFININDEETNTKIQ